MLVGLERSSRDRAARDRRPLAPRRIQVLLGVALPETAEARQAADSKRSAGPDLPHGVREPHLGGAEDSWRTQNARIRYLGTDRPALDAESLEKPGAGQAMGGISEQPPRSYCSNGLLHCADAHFWDAVLLLRDLP